LHPAVLGNIPKGLKPTYDVALRIVKRRGIYEQLDHFVPLVSDCNLHIAIWVAARKSTVNRAVFPAKGCSEEFHTLLAENFLFAESGDLLGRAVPRTYSPVLIKGHYPLGYAVKYRLKQLTVLHVFSPFVSSLRLVGGKSTCPAALRWHVRVPKTRGSEDVEAVTHQFYSDFVASVCGEKYAAYQVTAVRL
jgi:hypothetical protein